MAKRNAAITRLEEHPNLAEILGVLAQLALVRDAELPLLARAWDNNASVAAARCHALEPDGPLVVEVLVVFDALAALFADDLHGVAPYLTVDSATTTTALKAVRDAIAAAYARPILSVAEHKALFAPWRSVYPTDTVQEPDLGPRGWHITALLGALPVLSTRCHDPQSKALFESLVDRTFLDEGARAEASDAAFQAAVVTARRRTWALVRRSAAEGLSRPCGQCRRPADDERESQRVMALCLDAACALLVADALPSAALALLTDPVHVLLPQQRDAQD